MSGPISGQRRKLTKCKKCSEEFPTAELRWLHLCQNIKYEEQAIGDSSGNHEKAIGDFRDNHEKAIGDSRGNHEKAIGDSRGNHEKAIGDSKDNHEKAIGDSKDNHEKAIGDSRVNHENAIGDSRGNHEKDIGDSRDNHEKATNDSDDDIQMVSIRGDTNFIRQAINQAKVNIKEETDNTSEDMEVSNENLSEYNNNNLNESLNLNTNASVDTVIKFEIDFNQDISNQENEHQSNSIWMSPVSELITRDCEPDTEDYERGIAYSEDVNEEITIKDEFENLRQVDSANSRNDVELHRENEVTGNLGQSSGTQPHLQTIQRERSGETTLEDGGNINNNNSVSGAVKNNPETVKIGINMEMSATTFVRFSQRVFCAVNAQQNNFVVNAQQTNAVVNAQQTNAVVNAQQTNVEEQNGEDGTTQENIAEENNAQINVVEEINTQKNIAEENNPQKNVVEENISRQNVVEEQNERQTLRGRKRSRSKQTGIGENDF